ncbi:MAG: VTT domain-containing protein [Kofleriaceae bacterium]
MIAVVGSVIPIISIEVFLIGLAVLATGTSVAPIIILAAAGQVIGKLPIYSAARGLTVLSTRSPTQSQRIARIRRWFSRFRPTLVLAASALLGLPPFSLAATAAGVLAIPARTFCIVVGICRAARFAVIVVIARAW